MPDHSHIGRTTTFSGSTHYIPPVSLAAELRELAELRDQGILTAEEFDAQKARLFHR